MSTRLEPAVFAIYLAVLVWAPLPFASNRLWSSALLTVLVGILLCAWLCLAALGKSRLDIRLWRLVRLPLALLVMVQLWVFVQVLPLPREVVALLSPVAHGWHIGEGWLTLSLDPQYTRQYLLRGCMLTAGFFLTLALVNSPSRLTWLLRVLIFSGTAQAAYGLFMVLSSLELGFFVEKYGGRGSVTGTFVNRNHMAGYLVMTLSVGVGLLLANMDTRTSLSLREAARKWLRLLLSADIRLRLYLAIMIVALLLTQARMANIAFFIALGVAGTIAVLTGRRLSRGIVVFLGSLFVIDMLLLGKWFGAERLVRRMVDAGQDLEGRLSSLPSILDYVSAFPLTGSGGGSFYGVFPNFQAPEVAGYLVHAHNDYLEFAAELGLPATLLLVAFVILSFVVAVRVQLERHTALYKGAAFAVTMTIVWAAIHSFTDFNMQIPANALTFVTIVAVAYVSRALPRPLEG